MKKYSYPCDPSQNVGIYIALAMSDDAQFHYSLRLASAYRVRLRILLPLGVNSQWTAGILHIIRKVETGGAWPIRFDYNNLIEYIALTDVVKIEKGLPGVTAYVYNAPAEETRFGFDEETLHRIFNLSRRVARTAETSQLEGQMSLLEDMG